MPERTHSPKPIPKPYQLPQNKDHIRWNQDRRPDKAKNHPLTVRLRQQALAPRVAPPVLELVLVGLL
jgi:hypothetical protein